MNEQQRRDVVLVVDDSPDTLTLINDTLESSGMDVLLALDGKQALMIARRIRPDVILMDINLPGISGIDALKVLRADPATAHIPVVAISANAMLRDIEVGRQLGFFRYLTKPIVVEEFMTTLDLALESAQKNTGLISS